MLNIIEPEAPGQLDAVRRLCWDYHAYLRALSPFDAELVDCFYPRDKYQALLDRIEVDHAPPGGAIRLAVLDEQPVGCGMYHTFSDDTVEIKRVYVADDARGTGAGRAIMTSLTEQARDAGFKRILMDTSNPLKAAQSLYLSLGFKLRGPYQELPDMAAGHLLFFEMHL